MNTLNIKIKSTAKRAFTLIEIMVATVIMVVLVGLVIQITSEVLKVWTRSSGKLAANAEARIAMDLITQDLETAVFRNNGMQWLRVEAPKATGAVGAAEYTDQTVALKLFSPALDRPSDVAGDICGIAYRLKYQPSYSTGSDSVYALYRYIADPEVTFNSLMGPSSVSPDTQKLLTGGLWHEDSVTLEDNYLVSNIIEFKVLIYEEDGTGGAKLVNADANVNVDVNYSFGGTDATYTLTPGTQQSLLYADIMLTVISDTGLEMLQHIGNIPETADDVVRQHGEVFTRRVNFMAHPL